MSKSPRASSGPKAKGQFLVYEAEDGRLKIDVRLADETVWLTQAQMAELFQTSVPNVSIHIKNVFDEGELTPEATLKKFLTVRREGSREVQRSLDHYNLDMIISVGYRVKSHVATRFRIWATQRLKEYIIKGFTLDDERLKNPDQPFDYFEELTRRIQDIRTSERRFYQKITDIYATSIDYDPTLDISIRFFQTVQNKMHWAITGKTAAEIVHQRADADKPNMGLTNWRGAKVRKQDVTIAKNYLDEAELAALNNLVEQYLVFAEGQALRRIPMHMQDWISKLDAFLNINDREILTHAGKISHEMARDLARELEKGVIWPDSTLTSRHLCNWVKNVKDAKFARDPVILDVELVGAATAPVGNLVWHPILILIVIAVSRLPLFDAWNLPVPLLVVMGLALTYAVTSAWRLRRAAEAVRSNAIRKLTEELRRLRDQPDTDGQIKRVEEMLREVRATEEGAFRPFSRQPVVQAILTLISSLTGIAVLQYSSLVNL